MDKMFTGFFSRPPDEITDSNYYYRVGWYDKIWDEILSSPR